MRPHLLKLPLAHLLVQQVYLFILTHKKPGRCNVLCMLWSGKCRSHNSGGPGAHWLGTWSLLYDQWHMSHSPAAMVLDSLSTAKFDLHNQEEQ